MRAEIINVGTELLIGSTLNTHQQYLARELGKLGIDLYTALTLGDNPQRLGSALTTALHRSDLILVTGGLGPTDDDITVKAAARALGLELVLSPDVRDAIERRLRAAGRTMNAFQLRQAWVPQGARIFPNPNGTAPGIFITQKRAGRICRVALLPGPPRELKPMVQNHLNPLLHKILGPHRPTLIVRRLLFPGAVESQIAPKVNDWLNAAPPVTVGIYARAGEVELAVMAKHANAIQAERLASAAEQKILTRFGERLVLKHPETLLTLIARKLKRAGKTLVTAESCTGGLLAGRLTELPGASDYYAGGMNAYSNRIKTNVLGVEESIVRRYGAVSPQTALAMAERAAALFSGDYALSVTGIAGPTGGSAAKPVGLVYIALSERRAKTRVFRHRLLGGRQDVRVKAVQAALLHLATALSRSERT